ncbi:unnamed protein product, partial [Allacma fusca]
DEAMVFTIRKKQIQQYSSPNGKFLRFVIAFYTDMEKIHPYGSSIDSRDGFFDISVSSNTPNDSASINSSGGPVNGSNRNEQGVIVRGEEIGIVVVVLLLWVGAIILFFNRWGKIRMLEPYQPKFCEDHRPSCPMAEVTTVQQYPVSTSR